MNIALIRNGKVENIIVADLEFAQGLGYDELLDTTGTNIGIGWIKANGTFIDPAPIEPKSPIIGTLDFLDRLTDAEIKNILRLAKTNENVELWLMRFNKQTSIDLSSVKTISAINYMVIVGIITSNRATVILQP